MRIGMTAEEVETLKKGDVADITVVHIARPQTPIRFGMSLSGFTKAFLIPCLPSIHKQAICELARLSVAHFDLKIQR